MDEDTTPPRRLTPPGGVFTEPRDHGLGRSSGGFTTKLHLAVGQGQKPMSIVVTAGERGDSPQFETTTVHAAGEDMGNLTAEIQTFIASVA
ncbi:hypothetical protein ABZ886_12890 [Streptomyces spiralis]